MLSGPNKITPLEPAGESRLRLKPAVPATGHVDGAWWPSTRDLSAELPSLLAALESRLGRTDRVTYRLGEWQAPRRRLAAGEYVVRLEGFRSQPDDTLTVVGWNHHRLTLLVIPPETGPEVAGHVLATAADENNTDDSSRLLTARDTTAVRSRTTDGAPLPA